MGVVCLINPALFLLLLAVSASAKHHAEAPAPAPGPTDCSHTQLSLINCLSYLTNNATEKPEGDCCPKLRIALNEPDGEVCLCQGFNNSGGIGIIMDRAQNITTACNIIRTIPCVTSGPSAAPAPAFSPFPISPSGPVPPSGGSGVAQAPSSPGSNSTSLGPNVNGPSMFLYGLLLINFGLYVIEGR